MCKFLKAFLYQGRTQNDVSQKKCQVGSYSSHEVKKIMEKVHEEKDKSSPKEIYKKDGYVVVW